LTLPLLTCVAKVEDETDAERSLPSPPERESELLPTVRFPSAIPKLLIKLGDDDLEAERKRIEARKRRKAEKDGREKQPISAVAAESSPATATTPAASSMPPPSIAPSEAGTPGAGVKRKKGEKAGKLHFSDQAQRQAATSTAQLFVGGMGKKYSWLTAGASAPGTPKGGLSTGAGMSDRLVAQSTTKKEPTAATPTGPKGDPDLESQNSYKKLGLLKEPPGVQLRDVLGVLERQGTEKKALLRGYAKLDKEK
jgi:Transcription initiation factor TFIID component TAF4 family